MPTAVARPGGVAGLPSYPPSPWELRGRLDASVFLVPVDALPHAARFQLPAGWSLVRLGGRAVVAAVWVDYRPGGVLSYRELMTTVLVRRGARVLPHVTHIWVDSEASRAGGRALWGIPKQLADFDLVTWRSGRIGFGARDDEGPIAHARIMPPRLRVPGRMPAGFSVVQTLAGQTVISPVRCRARLAVPVVEIDAAPDGPLGFLAERRPIVSFTLDDFAMRFGR